jgi:hypothetical protein
MFDAILLNVLRKCNGCEAGLCVMVGGVEGAGWLCLCSRDSWLRKFYSSNSAHKAVSCHVGRQPTVINHYVRGHVGMVEFQSRVPPLLHGWIGTVIQDFRKWTVPPYYVVIPDREQ